MLLQISNFTSKEALDNIVVAGKINVKRGIGKPREMMLDGFRRWHGRTLPTELIHNKETEICRKSRMSMPFDKVHNDDI